MKSMDQDEFAKLLGRLTEQQLSPEEWSRLEQTLRDNPAARAQYREYISVHAMLYWHQRRADSDAKPRVTGEVPAVEGGGVHTVGGPPVLRRISSLLPQVIHPSHHPINFSLFSAFVTSVVVICFLVQTALFTYGPNPSQHGLDTSVTENAATPDRVLAKITGLYNEVWAKQVSRLAVTQFQKGDAFSLESGLVELSFKQGSRVLIEGPARFRVDGPGAGTLERGKLIAFVPRKARGFVIETPVARVVDLGTEFGVHVEDTATVAVFKGAVQLTSLLTDQSVQLTTGHQVRVPQLKDKNSGGSQGQLVIRRMQDKDQDFVRFGEFQRLRKQAAFNRLVRIKFVDSDKEPFSDSKRIVDRSNITVSAPSSKDAAASRLTDQIFGTPSGQIGAWYYVGEGIGESKKIYEVDFQFGTAVDLSGLKINWAWADRDNGRWEIVIDGNSLGAWYVDTLNTSQFPAASPDYIRFSRAVRGVQNLTLRVDKTGQVGREAFPALAEVTFYHSTTEEADTQGESQN